MKTDMILYSEVTEKIIGSLFEVHNQLGKGYQEKYYQRALEIELTKRGLRFEREKQIPVYYNEKKIGSHALDFVVEGCVVVELKALPQLTQKEENQLLRYLNYLQMKIGILANFGGDKVLFKRLLLPEKYIKGIKNQC